VKSADWLKKFGAALEKGDINAAAGMFEPGGYWRDLVSFTWNVKTCEGHAEIKAMLAAQIAGVKPKNFQAQTDEWFTFETAVGRGVGHLRLRGKHCFTLLTTLQELKGFEEKAGVHRESGVSQGKTWYEKREQHVAELGVLHQPYVLIVGGGQGGIALAARLKRLQVPTLVSRGTSAPAIPGGSATGRSACTTRCGTTTCRTCLSRTTGRCSRRRTRSPTGWRCTRG